jgi:bile acid:Na+ symporter, BASS family
VQRRTPQQPRRPRQRLERTYPQATGWCVALASATMPPRQLVLTLVVFTMVFSVALDLKLADFQRVARNRRAVVAGLVPQFVLLPMATWLATLVLDLPPSLEAAMLLVACCPGGALSNVVTHLGRGNTALSVSISAVSAVMALVLTPLNFTWMVASNPATAAWLKDLDVHAAGVLWSLLLMLALPMALGLLLAHQQPSWAARIKKPLARFSVLALLVFVVSGLINHLDQLKAQILMPACVVVLHNASGLLLGWLSARAFGVDEGAKRAIVIEGGMQNSALALGIIHAQFNADLGMVLVAGMWGIWHLVSGLAMVGHWRRADARLAV